ncbi:MULTISPECIES: zinc-binding dehydrogenase [Methylosinus]|nr:MULTISPECIES: zinc-binding dehydrogenase [Methylosinus]OBS51055.1 hypothetical protein A8B73_18225 [Methylosinus sp. 3S-1]
MTKTMTAIYFEAHGGPEQLRLAQRPIPEARGDLALVRVGAFSLNGFDPMVLRGIPELPIPLPMIPCADCAGEIVALGETERDAWKIGDRVSVVPLQPGRGMMGETLPGVAAQYCLAPLSALLPLPANLSFVDAAALPTAYGTAMRMMTHRAEVMRGERVLVLGAGGGVGVACVQIAKLRGAEVIACAEDEAALTKLRALGADHVIDARTDVLGEIIRLFGKPSIWGGGGVDVVVDFLGGADWRRSIACLTRGGRLVTCGASAGAQVATDLRYVWSFELDIRGSNGWTIEDQRDVIALAAERRLEPVIHAVRPMSSYGEALSELMARRVVGKSVIVVDEAGAASRSDCPPTRL